MANPAIAACVTANAVSTSVTTSSITTTSGHLLVVCLSAFTSVIGTTPVSDSKSNTWTLAGSKGGTTNGFGAIYYAANCTGGSGHTFTFTGTGSTNLCIAALDISGIQTSTPQSQANSNSTSGSSHSQNITTGSTIQEMVIAMCTLSHTTEFQAGVNLNIQGGYMIPAIVPPGSTPQGIAILAQVIPASTSTTPTIALATTFNEYFGVASFKAVSSGAAATGGAFAFA